MQLHTEKGNRGCASIGYEMRYGRENHEDSPRPNMRIEFFQALEQH